MTSKRFTDEFKAEAVKQVSERGYPLAEVVERLGVSVCSLYAWLRERSISRDARKAHKISFAAQCQSYRIPADSYCHSERVFA